LNPLLGIKGRFAAALCPGGTDRCGISATKRRAIGPIWKDRTTLPIRLNYRFGGRIVARYWTGGLIPRRRGSETPRPARECRPGTASSRSPNSWFSGSCSSKDLEQRGDSEKCHQALAAELSRLIRLYDDGGSRRR